MKIALVTGGSGGIGAAICRALAQQGLHVLVHANSNIERAQALVASIQDDGGSAESIRFDVSDADACRNALQTVIDRQAIQIVVNNAGAHADAPMAGMSVEQWRRTIDVNLNGFFNVTQPLLLPMMSTRWGRIINISSIAGIVGNRGQSNYAAAKSGLHGASKSLAIELASRGVTVNVVAPGIIDTEMTTSVFSKEQINSMVPMKRAGKPEEVASLVAFLATESASYISGQVIAVSGAMI